MNEPSKIPSRFSQRAVDRYDAYIVEIVRQWPTPLVFDPYPMALETFANRLRDAITAIVYYDATHANKKELISIAPQIVVRMREGKVVVGEYHTTKQPLSIPVTAPTTPSVYVADIDANDTQTLLATCQLLSNRTIRGPFRVTNIQGPDGVARLASLVAGYDVAVQAINDTTAILL